MDNCCLGGIDCFQSFFFGSGNQEEDPMLLGLLGVGSVVRLACSLFLDVKAEHDSR